MRRGDRARARALVVQATHWSTPSVHPAIRPWPGVKEKGRPSPPPSLRVDQPEGVVEPSAASMLSVGRRWGGGGSKGGRGVRGRKTSEFFSA